MTNEEAKDYVYDHYQDYLTRDNSGKGYVCPFCGSGTGSNGTGMLEHPAASRHFKCFSCDFYGDIIDIIAEDLSMPYPEKMKKVKEVCGIVGFSSYQRATPTKKPEAVDETLKEEAIKAAARSNNYVIAEAHKRLNKRNYHSERGISNATAERFRLGYWDFGTNGTALIIPTGERREAYTARFIASQTRYRKPKNTPTELFNAAALTNTTGKPVFVVEGEIDALSIEEVGGAAIGLGSTANVSKLISFLQGIDKTTPIPFIIAALDNDEQGQEAQAKLLKELANMGISCGSCNISGIYKDANDALMKNRESFTSRIRSMASVQSIEEMEKYKKMEAKKIDYLESNALNQLTALKEIIKQNAAKTAIPTGYAKLDNFLDGGLYEGLYVIGAISSLGKTTFCLQMADQIAASGNDVLIFSLEMSKFELMAKSISRNTYIYCKANRHDVSNAKTTRGILDGSKYKSYTEKEKLIIEKAGNMYAQYAEHIYIQEGVGNISVNEVREAVNNHILFTGRKPVVIIDYLQILAPVNDRGTDKQNTDKAILELKRISRDNGIPLIAISSFNRDNYTAEVSTKAFKESGCIEYSADVIFGLQLKGITDEDFNLKQSLRRNPREVELHILKNRNGRSNGAMSISFNAAYNYIEEQQQ